MAPDIISFLQALFFFIGYLSMYSKLVIARLSDQKWDSKDNLLS